MVPALNKPAGTHAGHHALPKVLDGSAASPADSGAAGQVPPVPDGLPPHLAESWRGLWSSPVAQLLDPVSDLPAVRRLWELYRLGERMDARIADSASEAEGPGLEAMIATRVRIASECRLLEDKLGLSPRSRLAMGLALLAGQQKGGGLDDLAESANGEG